MIRLGTFSRPGEDRPFAGARHRRGDRRRRLRPGCCHLTRRCARPDDRDLLADWDRCSLELDAAHRRRAAVAACASTPRCEPGQVLQSGANYRTHVIDLAAAHHAERGTRPDAEIRAEVAELMDRRAAEGTPYLFIGLPSAVTGPARRRHDPGLDAEVRLGARARRRDRPRGVPGRPRPRPRPRRRVHDRQRPHGPRPGVPPRHARDRHRLVPRQERPRLHPARPLARRRPATSATPATCASASSSTAR